MFWECQWIWDSATNWQEPVTKGRIYYVYIKQYNHKPLHFTSFNIVQYGTITQFYNTIWFNEQAYTLKYRPDVRVLIVFETGKLYVNQI